MVDFLVEFNNGIIVAVQAKSIPEAITAALPYLKRASRVKAVHTC